LGSFGIPTNDDNSSSGSTSGIGSFEFAKGHSGGNLAVDLNNGFIRGVLISERDKSQGTTSLSEINSYIS
jgi:hypothetical protein